MSVHNDSCYSDDSLLSNSRNGDPARESNGIERQARHEFKEEIMKDMAIDKMREKMNLMIQKVEQDMEKKLELLVEDLVSEVKLFNLKNYELRQLFREDSLTHSKPPEKRNRSNGKLPDKEFQARNSLLTDLFEVKHIKTIYHIFLVILIILFLNTVVHDFVDSGSINIGLRPIIIGFGKFHLALLIWACMQISSFALYVGFLVWAKIQSRIKKRNIQNFWNLTSVFGMVIYQSLFVGASIKAVVHFDLPVASSIATLMEMTRFVMKVHAFVRSNVPRVLSYQRKVKSSEEKPTHANMVPSFCKYAYFLFCPTLVYRDEYPRTKRIRWSMVFRHALEVIGAIFYVSFLVERFLVPLFDRFGNAQISSGKFVLSMFGSVMPASLCFLCAFYCLLHAWLNAFSEMLCFADRMFYQDWWNANTFPEYIRKWNVVVHDWLYTYIYKDSVEHVFKNCRSLATILVFTVSAVFHEVILAFAFRFFYPVMFVQFEFMGLMLMFLSRSLSKNMGNVALWLALCTGNGIQLGLYYMEYYARRNCPVSGNSLIDYMVPVSWSCNGISHNPNWTITAPWDLQ